MINADELRKKYIEFFKSKGHAEIAGAPLVPENDPTVLFTTAGMHPLVPYIMGEKHPEGKRLVNVQKCIRTTDIEEVGDNRHLTFFEMLGNWSLGDYFKKEAIEWSFEFLTSKKWLGIPVEKLAVTVFEGDRYSPRDEESAKVWESLRIPKERIFYLSKKENWWGPAGETGPCGPDTEMFFITDKKCPINDSKCSPACDCGKYMEIWNDVFMQYFKDEKGKFKEMKQKNVDTGMGVERVIAVLNGLETVFETELFKPIIDQIEKISGKKYKDDQKAFRIIVDHIKAAAFIIAEGVAPSNVDRGYILRRLIRRAVRYGRLLGINKSFASEIAESTIKIYKDIYPEVEKNKKRIFSELNKEEEKFRKTLERALDFFIPVARKRNKDGSFMDTQDEVAQRLYGGGAFDLFQSHGLPLEMIIEEAKKHGININEEKLKKSFLEDFKKHQELSRTASAGKFKGGLADASEETKKLHTVAHLLLESLRRVLGDHVFQKGSNITAERLRFDFSHPEKMTDVQKKKVEDMVNEQIQKGLDVNVEEMTVDEAKKQGAMGIFDSKYGEKVKVYTIGDSSASSEPPFSREICGGPHVSNTSELGHFKIKKEESSSAGVRRIKAVLENK